MEFYIIPPVANLDLMHKGDNRYFCLAQLYLKNQAYRDFFLNLHEDAWITLDNGAGDHDLVTEDVLFEVMHELMPNEVIPLDILFDGAETIENAESFYNRMKKEDLHKEIEIFFCPQGHTMEDWVYCYSWGLAQPWISTIGLSKIAIPNAWFNKRNDVGIMEARHNCFNYLKMHNLLSKPLHLLGMGDPREFAYYQQSEQGKKYVRSSDSCNSVWSAMNDMEWSSGQFDRIPTPKDYFDREVIQDMIHPILVDSNIDYLKSSVL